VPKLATPANAVSTAMIDRAVRSRGVMPAMVRPRQ
jgi:hypothetical protein